MRCDGVASPAELRSDILYKKNASTLARVTRATRSAELMEKHPCARARAQVGTVTIMLFRNNEQITSVLFNYITSRETGIFDLAKFC